MVMRTVFPDACKTPAPPPIPIPYPNLGKSSDTDVGPMTVKTDGVMPMVKGTQYMMSTGDETGALLGVTSNMIKGPCEYTVYSFDVKFEGKNVCRMGDQLWHIKKNICGRVARSPTEALSRRLRQH